MYRESVFVILFLPICLIIGGFPISVSAQQGPNDVVAEPGDVVSFTFSDETTTTSDYFFWVRYNPKSSTIYAQGDTQPADPVKYSVVNNGSFVLTVNSVAFADAATYCFFSSKTKQQLCGNLVVIESVNATVYPSNGLSVGQTANLTCEVEYAGPTTDEDNIKPLSEDQQPQLSMYIGNTQITNLPPGEDIIDSDKMTHTRSVSINRTMIASDVGQDLICKATTKSPQFNLSSSTSLEVISNTTYANIDVLINATTNPGGRCCRINAILNCTANGYPYPQFKWTTVDGLTLLPSKSGNGYSELLITIVGTFTVVCSARNNMSSMWQNDTITLNSFTGLEPEIFRSASGSTEISSLLLFFLVLLHLLASRPSYF